MLFSHSAPPVDYFEYFVFERSVNERTTTIPERKIWNAEFPLSHFGRKKGRVFIVRFRRIKEVLRNFAKNFSAISCRVLSALKRNAAAETDGILKMKRARLCFGAIRYLEDDKSIYVPTYTYTLIPYETYCNTAAS